MKLPGPSWWCGLPLSNWCYLLLPPKPCQPQVPLSLAQRPSWASLQLRPGCWSTQDPSPPLSHTLLSSGSKPLRSSGLLPRLRQPPQDTLQLSVPRTHSCLLLGPHR